MRKGNDRKRMENSKYLTLIALDTGMMVSIGLRFIVGLNGVGIFTNWNYTFVFICQIGFFRRVTQHTSCLCM